MQIEGSFGRIVGELGCTALLPWVGSVQSTATKGARQLLQEIDSIEGVIIVATSGREVNGVGSVLVLDGWLHVGAGVAERGHHLLVSGTRGWKSSLK